jgi:hypothetical protein
MSIEAFTTRRVREALTALGDYLDAGVKLAGGIPPAKSVKLDLEPIASEPSPRLTKVTWADGSQVIRLPLGTPNQNVLVTGENLKETVLFKLVAATGPTYFEARVKDTNSEITDLGKTGFTAHMTLTNPSLGSYHAFVVTDSGQTFLLRDAVAIEPAKTEPETRIQLGEAKPNEANPSQYLTVALLLLRGRATDVSRVYVTDSAHVPQDGWKIGIKPDANKPEVLDVALSVPKTATLGLYIIVAQSDLLNSEDRLAFFVREKSS